MRYHAIFTSGDHLAGPVSSELPALLWTGMGVSLTVSAEERIWPFWKKGGKHKAVEGSEEGQVYVTVPLTLGVGF